MNTPFHRRQRELSAALQALRLLVKEVGGNYLAGLQADIARVDQALRDLEASPRRTTQLRRMAGWIDQLDIKPQKGRRRDLKALDQLVKRLTETVEEW